MIRQALDSGGPLNRMAKCLSRIILKNKKIDWLDDKILFSMILMDVGIRVFIPLVAKFLYCN